MPISHRSKFTVYRRPTQLQPDQSAAQITGSVGPIPIPAVPRRPDAAEPTRASTRSGCSPSVAVLRLLAPLTGRSRGTDAQGMCFRRALLVERKRMLFGIVSVVFHGILDRSTRIPEHLHLRHAHYLSGALVDPRGPRKASEMSSSRRARRTRPPPRPGAGRGFDRARCAWWGVWLACGTAVALATSGAPGCSSAFADERSACTCTPNHTSIRI